ncbi:MAG: lysine--tRNA ligase [Microgenomates group bacterium]
MSTIDQLRKIRLEKIAKLKELGINSYPPHSQKDASNFAIVNTFEKFQGQTLHLCGRIMSFRKQGGITFAHIQDESAKIQVFIRKQTLQPTNAQKQILGYEDIRLLDIGDFIEVTGVIDKTSTGEVSILADTIKLLTKSIRPLPEKWSGIKDQETIFRRRYLDLIMNDESKKLFIRKAKFWQLNRQFLADKGFIEVETPIMELVTGGADAKPFITHHNALDQDFYLRISSELYQKRLIGGGFEKIYTLGPNFRNEGIDDEHLQEYYQCEWYWAYADYRQNMELVEELYKYIAQNLYGKYVFTRGEHTFDLNVNWPRISYGDLIKNRFQVDILLDSEDKILKILKSQKIDTSGLTNRARIVDNLWKIVRREIAGPIFIIDEPKFSSPLAKSREDNPDLTERFHVIIAGSELGNGYTELNDPVDQFERFADQQKNRDSGDDESQMMDIDFVEMLEWGMPPTSGWGHSERLFWFFENVTAREGTLFPQMKYEISDETRRIYNLPKHHVIAPRHDEALAKSEAAGLQNNKVVIGKILEFNTHPNADKLHVLLVDIGSDKLQIVCGAHNIKVGDIVPVSLIGATVYGDEMVPWTVGPSKLRGVDSNGMLCSTRELGLGPDHDGIYLLSEDLSSHLGEPVNKYFKING